MAPGPLPRAALPRQRAAVMAALVAAVVLAAVPGVVGAHGGALSGARPARLAVPAWLLLVTGGAVVGVSVLLASFATDPALVEPGRPWRRSFDGARLRRALAPAGRLAGLVALAAVVAAGLFGPTPGVRRAAVLVVWAGWWGGYAATVYLVGNTWQTVDPFATLARPLGDGLVEYPDRLGRWPAVAGLLLLVWVEVASPLADRPRWLALAAAGYLLCTLVGAGLVGVGPWFRNVDPLSAAFRQYGRLAPLQRSPRGVRLALPGSTVVEGAPADRAEVGLVLALVWGTAFDGLVHTPPWAAALRRLAGVGVPPDLLYALALAAGFLLLVALFRLAAAAVRRSAPTCLPRATVEGAFAPPLLAVAAGYHLAHHLGSLLALAPGPSPAWVGGLSAAAVLGGHLLAVWLAHGVALRRFPSRVQAIRSQYPVAAVTVGLTMLSLWIVTRPYVAPPFA